MDAFAEHGATVIAISPQQPRFSRSLIERHKLRFDILHDPGSATAEAYRLRFELPDALIATYRHLGIDLEESNGDTDWRLPLPARYIIDRTGAVRYARVNADYRFRPDPEETVGALARVVGNAQG